MRKRGTIAALVTIGALVGALLVGASPANAATTTYVSVLTPSGYTGKKVIDIQYESTANRGIATIYDLRTTGNFENQRWTITKVGVVGLNPTYTLRNVNSGLCLDKSQDVPDANGNRVYQYTCSGTANQEWMAVTVVSGSPYVELMNVSDDRCLDVETGKFGAFLNSQPLQVWACSGSWNQRWNIS